ncbi:MAG: formylmethanofuran dehydrogenase subunit B [Chloroflexi bacterium]|nr:formylmethanofuran dehydrogenase subunit B [Chloroflexota bacterium]
MASTATTVCTACSCLCDDIGLQLEDDIIRRVENACRKGSSSLYGARFEQRRSRHLVEGREVGADEAIDRAAAELSRARRPLIFGLDNSSLEAQGAGIELARRLRCVIDDTSSFCQGNLVGQILSGALPSCTLPEVKTSDLILYWGANPHHSHPRHLSKFTIYAHPDYTELGAVRRVTLAAVEVRESETSSVCHRVFRILPRADRDLISAIGKGMAGQETSADGKRVVDLFRKAKFTVIFAGLGLTYSLDNDYLPFIEMVKQLSSWGRVAVIPMVGHYNMRGFNQSLHKAAGHVNKVSFADGVSSGDQFSFLEQVRNRSFDCLMVIGSDPFASLPKSVSSALEGIPRIVIDPYQSATSEGSTVVIGSAVTGVEAAGTAVRMDGAEVKLLPPLAPSRPGDEEILRRVMEKVSR